jgi:hypothetical protein
MNNLDKIKQLKSWGMNLTPANYSPDNKERDKLPVAVKNGDGKWHWNINGTSKVWSDEELAAALDNKRLAVYHNPEKYGATGQRFFDAESDDKTFRINKYMELWPETYTIGKTVNGVNHNTHKLYKLPKDVEVKQYSYAHKNEGTKVELLCSGVSIIDGLDRLITNDKEPVEADPKVILQHLKLSTFLAEIEPDWKEKVKKRDEAHLTLAATLAKQTDLPTKLKESYIRLFCKRVGDEEVNKRVTKVKAQEEAFKKGEEIQGIDALAKLLGGNYKSFDELKREDLSEDKEEKKEEVWIDYPIINASKFAQINYKDPSYLLEPLYTEQSTNQIFGPAGVGKSIIGQSQSLAMSSGHDWLGYKCIKPIPTLYVEGELPGAVLRSRQDTMLNDYFDKGKEINPQWSFTLCRDDLEMAGLKYGFEPIAISRKDAEDLGQKGRRLIENVIAKIKKQTGQDRVFLFLDNITALTSIDENTAADWTPLLQWTNTLKARGVPNLLVHHANKSGSSSGSSAKERMLDTQILCEALADDQRFNMQGNKNMQCRVSFKKARNFGGGKWDKPFLTTMDENGVWSRYSDLKQCDFRIIKLWKDGERSVETLRKDKDVGLGLSTFYKHLKVLKDEKLISDKDLIPTKEKEDF